MSWLLARTFPATNGSKIRVYNLLAHLGRTHHVDLVSFHAPEEPVGEADLEAIFGTYLRRFPDDYLAGQFYLAPHPDELMLRNQI